jgi:anti-sigma-K factor RskA
LDFEGFGLQMMAYSEDHIALAAEYALGTLDAEERAQVEAMMSVDKDFTSMVEAWEQKLGVLNQMVGSVEPRPIVWENIKAAIGHSAAQATLALPESPPVPAPDIVQPEVVQSEALQSEALQPEALQPEALQPEFLSEFLVDNAKVIQLSSQARRWRNVATAMSAIAAALLAMFTIGIYQPNLLPDGLRPKPRTRFVEVKAPATVPAPPSAQYVAVLQKQGGAPAFILTVDGATKNFTIRKVDATPEAGKSFELWLISDRLPKPRSLGVIGNGDFTARPVLASYDADIINTATYAVTVEQAGGSPDGNPHSTPVFTGKLLETVPPPAPSPPR